MGNIGKRICQKQLILLQTLLLQLQRARDFIEITVQYAELSFPVLGNIKCSIALIYLTVNTLTAFSAVHSGTG